MTIIINIRVNIASTGSGIKKNDIDIDKIWDKYYKLDKRHKRNTIETGRGLSIVKNIFELHNYTYGVILKKNKGITFFFEIKEKNVKNID